MGAAFLTTFTTLLTAFLTPFAIFETAFLAFLKNFLTKPKNSGKPVSGLIEFALDPTT